MGVTEDRYRRASNKIKRLEYIAHRKSEITRIITEESTANIETLLPEYDNLLFEEDKIETNLKIEFRASSIAEVINILRKKNFYRTENSDASKK